MYSFFDSLCTCIANLKWSFVWRDGSLTAPGGPKIAPAEEGRSTIDEQPIPKLGGPTYKQVKPKTYQVLEEQLQSGDTAPAAAAGMQYLSYTYLHRPTAVLGLSWQ